MEDGGITRRHMASRHLDTSLQCEEGGVASETLSYSSDLLRWDDLGQLGACLALALSTAVIAAQQSPGKWYGGNFSTLWLCTTQAMHKYFVWTIPI